MNTFSDIGTHLFNLIRAILITYLSVNISSVIAKRKLRIWVANVCFPCIINTDNVRVFESKNNFIRIFEALTFIIIIQIQLYGYSIIIHAQPNTSVQSFIDVFLH